MTHPFESIPPALQARIFLPTLLLTVAMMIALGRIGSRLVLTAPPQDASSMIAFELSGSNDRARSIVDRWKEEKKLHYARLSLLIDFLFIPLYSTTIAMACIWAAGVFGGYPIANAFGLGLAWSQWLAALLDVLENIALLAIIAAISSHGSQSLSAWALTARICATTKFSLVAVGLVYSLSACAAWSVPYASRLLR